MKCKFIKADGKRCANPANYKTGCCWLSGHQVKMEFDILADAKAKQEQLSRLLDEQTGNENEEDNLDVLTLAKLFAVHSQNFSRLILSMRRANIISNGDDLLETLDAAIEEIAEQYDIEL